MQSNYINYRDIPTAMFFPPVRTDEDVFIYKSQYVPNANVKPSTEFSKAEMSQVPTMAWMANHNFILVTRNTPENTYGTEIQEVKSPIEWFKSIEDKCELFNIQKKDLKIVAFDLETTGLNTNFRTHGGQMYRYETIVGVCLAIDEDTGYYLPLLHTEEDGVLNWNQDEIYELLNYLTDDSKFFLTLHNAQYDFAILRAHGLRVPKLCNDTLILSKLMNNFEFFPYGVRDGLKPLSEHVLKRKMIEIHEMFGGKDMVLFNTLSATTATVYASSDAINSLSLMHSFVQRDEFGRNPWKVQFNNCLIVHSYIYHIISQSSTGIPIDYDHAMATLRTTIRRVILLERRWAEIMEANKAEYKITSNEQANIFVGSILRNNYFGEPSTFDTWATETFGTTIKHVTVGKDALQRTKTTYGMDDNVITSIKSNIDKFEYSAEIKQMVKDTLDIVSLYRSLTHDVPMYTGLIRSAFRDDRGICFGNALTRMEGTDCLIAGTPVNAKVDGTEISTTMDKLGLFCPEYSGEEGVYPFFPYVELQCGVDEWVNITHFVTKEKDTLEIVTDRTSIGSAVKHRFMGANDEWIFADEVKTGDKLKTIYGYDIVSGVVPLGVQMTYDVVTNHKD